MSQQPRQVPTHSSSPSKSSRRTPSGGGTSAQSIPQQQSASTTATRNLLPSPQFEDDPIVASHQQYSQRPNLTLNDPAYSEHAVAESEHYSHHGQASVQQPQASDSIPSFQPFFALIEDSVTNEHHHPTVHYIFADDDTDIITEAALRSLKVLDPSQRSAQSQARDTGREDDGSNPSRLPPSFSGTREHYIVLDVQPQARPQASTTAPLEEPSASAMAPATYAYEVSSAHSLSAEWQVLRTSISTAPTIGDNASTEDDGLMLRIEGRGNTPGDPTSGSEKGKGKDGEVDKEKEKETMEEMIERFQRRLEDIKMVVDLGGGRVPGQDAAGVED